jgi:N-methylhydantoinase A
VTLDVAVDVGGTFTDVVLADVDNATTSIIKIPTTADPADGIISGILEALRRVNHPVDALTALHYGSTCALNALLTRSGPRIGLITTEGFGQILHLAKSQTPGPLVGWLNWLKPEPLVSLEYTRTISERTRANGSVDQPIDAAEIRVTIEDLLLTGVEALAVVFMHSYANPDHEMQVREVAHELAPQLHVCLSSEVLPEYREYERAITTVVNTFVHPTLADHLNGFEERLKETGITCNFNVVRSDGGLMTSKAAAETPVQTLVSGPSGGVSGALAAAAASGYLDLLTVDMGGTSTDVSLCIDGKPAISREFEIIDLPIRTPSIDVRSIGAGGGSIAHIPEFIHGLRVGPESAGARPGPACYGQGGTAPTVTDANLLLGRIPDATLLGGALQLDPSAALKAVSELGTQLGLSPLELAQAIVDIADEKMAGALRVISIERGIDPRRLTLVAFGGAGPLHGASLANLLGCPQVLVPPSPGVLSAYGFHTAGHRNTFSQSMIMTMNAESYSSLTEGFSKLISSAGEWLSSQPDRTGTLNLSCDMRFLRQGYEVEIEIPEITPDDLWIHRAIETFQEAHGQLYGFVPDADVEAVNLRVEADSPSPFKAPEPEETFPSDGRDARVGSGTVYAAGVPVKATIYQREALLRGTELLGPAVLVEEDATTYLPPGHRARIDAVANLIIAPELPA